MGVVAGRYRYMHRLLQLDSQTPTHLSPSWPVCMTPIRADILARYLLSHPDQSFATYINQVLSLGFRIGFDSLNHPLRAAGHNHPSSLANPHVVRDRLREEVQIGRLVGPLPQPWQRVVHCSPIGLVPKAHVHNKWRMIVDLSSPRGSSINDGINEESCSLSYVSLDDAVGLIQSLGPCTQLVKMDLKDAYRLIPVHPDDQHLLAISWENNVYIDRALPFGLRSAPILFAAVANALSWTLYSRGIRYLLHYLDDFLVLGAPYTHEAPAASDLAASTFHELGVPVASHKTEGPSTCITFLGILVDTVAFQLRLPREKLHRLQEMAIHWQKKKACTQKELESLLGHLSHAAMVIHPGRIFLRSLFALLPQAPRPHHFVRLNRIARANLLWWTFFLHQWNGVSLLPPKTPTIHIFSDASGSFGCGAFNIQSGLFQVMWPPSWSSVEISVKELVPVVLAAAVWGSTWSGHHVLFHVENMAVVAVLQKKASKDSLLTHLIRCLSFYAAYHRFEFSATHIPGRENVAADALSRNNLHLFSILFPQVLYQPIPPTLQEVIIQRSPDWSSNEWTTSFTNSLTVVFPPAQKQAIGQV